MRTGLVLGIIALIAIALVAIYFATLPPPPTQTTPTATPTVATPPTTTPTPTTPNAYSNTHHRAHSNPNAQPHWRCVCFYTDRRHADCD